MFHGYAAGKAALLPEAKAFYELGHATLLVDFRGSGGSDGDETTLGVDEAKDVAAAVAYAFERWPSRPLILFGQSMGSAAILRAMATGEIAWNRRGPVPLGRGHPGTPIGVNGLILECPFDRLTSTAANRFSAMGLPSFPCAQLLVFWGGVQHGFNAFRHNPVEYAAAVRSPILLLHGAEDTRVTKQQAESIFARIQGRKEFVCFTGVGHESYCVADPRAWKEHVAQFLDQIGASDERCAFSRDISSRPSPSLVVEAVTSLSCIGSEQYALAASRQPTRSCAATLL
jgi:alpha-beta hydrolase superfamily lysophospholipase